MQNIPMLALADLEGKSREEVIDHITREYEANRFDVERFDIVAAYEHVGDYGCDSASMFVLRDRESGRWYVNEGGHCSCNGFEGQWKPKKVTLAYLKSEHFRLSTGGYDGKGGINMDVFKRHLLNIDN